MEHRESPSQTQNSSTHGCRSSAAANESEELRMLLNKAADVFSEYVARCQTDETPIVALESSGAEELAAEFAQRISVSDTGAGDKIWDEIKQVCGLATNTWSERFLYKLYAAPTPIGVVSEALVGMLNNNAHVFNASPVGVVVEAVVASKLAELANFPAKTAGGLTFPGGSYSNIHALMVARSQRFPGLKAKGAAALGGKRPVVFTSQHAHYSIEKAAIAAGVGLDNVVHVPVDGKGRMDAAALRRLVEREEASDGAPFFVNATAGTTVLGAFDPLAEIASVCEDHGLWLHVDASWGGPLALFADRSVFAYDIPHARVHSLTINPHKLLGIPLQCSVLLVRDGLRVMKEALGLNASYLFHDDDDDDDAGQEANSEAALWLDRVGGSWDVGDATLGCGRRPDAIKMWVTWRYYGSQYFSDRVNSARSAAVAFAQLLRTRNEAEPTGGFWWLLAAPESTCVCFWYVPRAIYSDDIADFEAVRQRALCAPPSDDIFAQEYDPKWGHATRALFGRLNALSSKVLVDYAQLDAAAPDSRKKVCKVPAFFRIPFNNPSITTSTMASNQLH
ncbi:Glutamate decarboxylase 2 [Coemansia sp. RSA 2399]|nr:Glutamate decarboxylase 2 [Coemansia sp. RSA 2399]